MESNKRNIDDYKQKIKDSGFRITGTRMLILDILLKSSKALNAEELFFLARKKQPGIGQATVYRTLKLLEKEGLIIRAIYENDKAKYAIEQYSSDKNKIKIDTGDRLKADFDHKSNVVGKSTPGNFEDTKRINTIQNQLTEWLSDLDKIKREKESVLEEAMEDFGKVDKIMDRHNHEKGNLIQILLDVQNEYNWLPRHILLYIGNKLDVPLTNIYGITTFYKYFNLEPQGKYSIVACVGTACHVRGAMNLLQRITSVLGVKPGDTTDDFRFTLKTVNCLGCCALGPVVMIGNKYYSNPSTGQLKKILKQLS
jgi:NADH-quinone oxidoreductase subunit E